MNPGFEGSGSCEDGSIAGVIGDTFFDCNVGMVEFAEFPAGTNWVYHSPAFLGGLAPILSCGTGPSTQNQYVLSLYVTPQDCPEDLDGSGDVAFNDLLTLLVVWGECPDCPEDFDGDGTVGFSDLLQLLVAWGDCE